MANPTIVALSSSRIRFLNTKRITIYAYTTPATSSKTSYVLSKASIRLSLRIVSLSLLLHPVMETTSHMGRSIRGTSTCEQVPRLHINQIQRTIPVHEISLTFLTTAYYSGAWIYQVDLDILGATALDLQNKTLSWRMQRTALSIVTFIGDSTTH